MMSKFWRLNALLVNRLLITSSMMEDAHVVRAELGNMGSIR